MPVRRRGPGRIAGALAAWLGLAVALGGSGPAHADPALDYVLHCMGCHGSRAEGVPGKVPPLARTLTRFMQSPEGRDYLLRVPGAANSMLSDARLAEVLNWIAERYPGDAAGGAPARFTTAEVSASRHTPLPSVKAARHRLLQDLAATGAAPAEEY